jgi:hypothetical protein
MKKLLGFVFLGALCSQAFGQYNFDKEDEVKHHQISFNGSTSTWGLLFKVDGNLNWKTDSAGIGYHGRSTPAIQLGYDYFFNKDMSLGIIGSSQNMGMKVDYLFFKNPNDILRGFNDIDIKIKRRYIGLKFNYHFINDAKNDLYLGARFGAVFWKISPSVTDTDLDNKLSASFPGSILPSLAVGYKYKIKERVGMGFELSLGIPQLFSYGIDYRF